LADFFETPAPLREAKCGTMKSVMSLAKVECKIIVPQNFCSVNRKVNIKWLEITKRIRAAGWQIAVPCGRLTLKDEGAQDVQIASAWGVVPKDTNLS
jgi:hypothetical protein